MNKNNGVVYAVITVFALLVLAGFYLVFDKISTLSGDIKNVQLAFELSQKKDVPADVPAPAPEPVPAPKETPVPPATSNTKVSVPTAIIFTTRSSPNLQPQVNLIVNVESAEKDSQGNVGVMIKVFNNESAGYSALEPGELFAVVDLEGNSQRPLSVNGQFGSLPPKSAVPGVIVFKIGADKETLILQVGSGSDLKFYEFDFNKKEYKETVIG